MITSYAIIYLREKCVLASKKKRNQIKVSRDQGTRRSMPFKETEESVAADKEEEEKEEEITCCSQGHKKEEKGKMVDKKSVEGEKKRQNRTVLRKDAK